ncbi:tRNA (adenosine(37)-N6)-dimethylallyltransferase MiaA [Bacillaceae bacterium SIJ1]|uniref:tRNA (adenosine(37)-N6)-dimethylallyltransferase MiaA n=1 Tax=Litoribacterium kuwaitense TaxID=1398745 RepID=UPI0013ED127D|nr:tRNA (adenosine(37)-N6)-dimethylallyltransferase MiaA [Litoribacterium kuwaitense]NGP44055.1 tRNA (adenosine(37)-N6)-dimethylallyltransferase MiaA [Litoribacterium kuwaitense]
MYENPLLVIVGPTAVGKTALGIELAKRLGGEIISGDALQVYQGFDIGTAKVTEEERQEITHHFIDTLPPDASYSVADFKEQALKKIHDIHTAKKLPMIVGGTGLYIQSVVYPYEFTDQGSSPELRKRLEKEAERFGQEQLHQRLQAIDQEAAKRIHPNNVRRVIRALEIYEMTNETPTAQLRKQSTDYRFPTLLVGLTMERATLYQTINQRVEQMVEEGLFDEVKDLLDRGYKNTQAMQAIGYKEIVAYYDGECSKDESIAQLKKNTRRFAKRQLTWFRNKMDVTWFDVTDRPPTQEIANEILPLIAGKLTF